VLDRADAPLRAPVAARITTTDKHARVPSVVALSPADPLVGYLLVDDPVQL